MLLALSAVLWLGEMRSRQSGQFRCRFTIQWNHVRQRWIITIYDAVSWRGMHTKKHLVLALPYYLVHGPVHGFVGNILL